MQISGREMVVFEKKKKKNIFISTSETLKKIKNTMFFPIVINNKFQSQLPDHVTSKHIVMIRKLTVINSKLVLTT